MMHLLYGSALVGIAGCIGHATAEPVSPDASPTVVVRDLCSEWTGDWEAVRRHALWEAVGVDPEGLEWSARGEGEGLEVAAAYRYRDINCDGLADAFIGLHDGEVVHWFFAMGEGPRSWGVPKYLGDGRCRADKDEPLEDAEDHWFRWPHCVTVGNRTLISVAEGEHAWREKSDYVLYELIDNEAMLLLRDSWYGNGDRWELGRWNAVNFNDPDALLLVTYRTGRNHERIGWKGWRIEPSKRVAHEYEIVEDEYYAISRNHFKTQDPEHATHQLHPERLKRLLTGEAGAVLEHPVWRELGADPKSRGFSGEEEILESAMMDAQLAEEDPEYRENNVDPNWNGPLIDYFVKELGWIYALECGVVYRDFDDDGLLDAFLMLQQLGQTYWLVMEQTEPEVWNCAGLFGSIFTEHSRPDEHRPLVPEVSHLGGRTLLVVPSGGGAAGWYEYASTVVLLKDGKSHILWSDVVDSSENGSRGLNLSELDDGSVQLTVETMKTNLTTRENEMVVTRRYRLAPDATQLELVATEEAAPTRR